MKYIYKDEILKNSLKSNLIVDNQIKSVEWETSTLVPVAHDLELASKISFNINYVSIIGGGGTLADYFVVPNTFNPIQGEIINIPGDFTRKYRELTVTLTFEITSAINVPIRGFVIVGKISRRQFNDYGVAGWTAGDIYTEEISFPIIDINPGQTVLVRDVTFEIYRQHGNSHIYALNAEFNLDISTYDIIRTTDKVGVGIENVFLLKSSELLQVETTKNDEPIGIYNANNIIDEWYEGKQTVLLKKVINDETSLNYVGDEVIVLNVRESDLTNINLQSIARKKDGTAKSFIITSAEFVYNGSFTQIIDMVEKTKP